MPKHADYVDNIIEAMSIKYNNRVYELKEQGFDITVLSYGEAYFDLPLYPFDDLPFPDIYHYSHSKGIPELRSKLAQYYGEEYGVSVDPSNELIVTSGSKIGIHMALMTILNPGDEVIFREPAWVSYPEQTLLCHGIPVRMPYQESYFDVEKYITPRTKVIIINNPNNPTGWIHSREELDFLHNVADKHDIYILSDEAYSDYVLDEHEFVSLGSGDPNKQHSIVCNSMSKNYGISGWRVGYVITNPELIDQILKVNQHLITCPATILEYYLDRHFNDILNITKPQIRSVVEKRRTIGAFMGTLGLQYMPGDGTFYYFVSIDPSTLTSTEFSDQLLENHHVSTIPGIGFGRSCDKFIRISVGTQEVDDIKQGLIKIHELIANTSD